MPTAGDELDRLATAESARQGISYGDALDNIIDDPAHRSLVEAYNRSPGTQVSGGRDVELRGGKVDGGHDKALLNQQAAGDRLDFLATSRLDQHGGNYDAAFAAVCDQHPNLAAAYNAVAGREPVAVEPVRSRALSPSEIKLAEANGETLVLKLSDPGAGGGTFLASAL